jgi:putative transposase
VVRQCELLSIHRSGLYYAPKPESELNLELMRLIDEQHMKYPFLGVPRMTAWLRKDLGKMVNHKRIARLYRVMGIQAIGPKPNTSKRRMAPGHKVYPYLLRHLKIERPNQVWAMDITYIPVQGGFLYLVAIIDLYSRFIVGWSLSNTMQAEWCRQVLEQAVEEHGKPEILNTDQGSQFTAELFRDYVTKELNIRFSMDGKGRAIDNIFIERFWRSLKYEHVYLYPASDGIECYEGIKKYMDYYNYERRHQSLNDQIPAQIRARAFQAAA